MSEEKDIVYRLQSRAKIRRMIPTRKSVQKGEPDKLADLLDEAADEIKKLRTELHIHSNMSVYLL